MCYGAISAIYLICYSTRCSLASRESREAHNFISAEEPIILDYTFLAFFSDYLWEIPAARTCHTRRTICVLVLWSSAHPHIALTSQSYRSILWFEPASGSVPQESALFFFSFFCLGFWTLFGTLERVGKKRTYCLLIPLISFPSPLSIYSFDLFINVFLVTINSISEGGLILHWASIIPARQKRARR